MTRRKSKSPSENEIHLHAWHWVRKTHPNLLIFHVANERKGGIGAIRHFERMGVRKGVADFLTFPAGRAVAIELKDNEGKQDDAQKKFQREWEAAGHAYFLVRSLEEFQGVIGALTLFSSMPPPLF